MLESFLSLFHNPYKKVHFKASIFFFLLMFHSKDHYYSTRHLVQPHLDDICIKGHDRRKSCALAITIGKH